MQPEKPYLKGVILKTTPFCNLSCSYCYNNSPSFRKKNLDYKLLNLDPHNLTLFLEKIFVSEEINLTRPFQIIWHGGEPLLLDATYLEVMCSEVLDMSSNYGIKITNIIQTNGTTLTETHCKVLKHYNFRVGLSCDGPEEICNLYRKLPNGTGAFNLITKGANLLRSYGLTFGIIATVTKESIGYCKEIYNTSKLLGAKALRVKSLRPVGRGADLSPLHPVDYIRFLKELFDVWIKDCDVYGCSPLEDIAYGLITGRTSLCVFDGSSCSYWLTLTQSGDIYPCEELTAYPIFKLGKISGDLRTWIGSEGWKKLRYFLELKKKSCPSKCNYKSICNGGCLMNFLIFNRVYYCYEELFNYIDNTLKTFESERFDSN
ncbi:MAG: radical SAM protein [Nitrososphaeria archaeon]